VHGIASVFCPVSYRRTGYAARMMRKLNKVLYTWQTKQVPCVGTTLYSDIGKCYYAKLWWVPNKTNSNIEIEPKPQPWPLIAREITERELVPARRSHHPISHGRANEGVRYTLHYHSRSRAHGLAFSQRDLRHQIPLRRITCRKRRDSWVTGQSNMGAMDTTILWST
jgi:hypothetical protein